MPTALTARLLAQLPPEAAHAAALASLRFSHRFSLSRQPKPPDGILRQTLWGLSFASPLGLAAGFDKQAAAVPALFHFGFGFVEIGGVTPRPQPGNPRPRLFRLRQDQAVINRFGLNSAGGAVIRRRLEAARQQALPGPVAINIAPNKQSDDPNGEVAELVQALAPLVDIIVINPSSPNTPGLREFQFGDLLARLIAHVVKARDASGAKARIVIKLAPDLNETQIDQIVVAVEAQAIDGLVLTNSTIARPASLRSPHALEAGGLSGLPLRSLADGILEAFARRLEGRLPLIGVGGVFDAADVWRKIRLGASLVQVYTGFAIRGPVLVEEVHRDLPDLLREAGFSTLDQAIGTGLSQR